MKKMKYIFIAFITVIVGIIMIYLVRWYTQSAEISAALEPVRSHDFSQAEKQVKTKILAMVEQVVLFPDSAGSWGCLGMNLYIHDYKQLAVPFFKKAAEIDSDDFRWPYFCAVTLDELNSDQAIQWYERSIILNPAYPPLGVKLGDRYLLLGQYEKAAESFNSVLEQNYEVPHAYLGLAKISIGKGELQSAKESLNKAMELAPQYREAHALMAEIYRREGNKAGAENEFEMMKTLPSRLDLSDPVYYQMVDEGVSSFWCQVRGNNFLNRGDLFAAEEEFKKAVQAKPNQTSFTSLGYVYQLQKKYDLAIQQYQTALDLDSNYVDALNNLGIIYFNRGDTDNALELVHRALKLKPESVDCLLNLGTFYKSRDEHKKAFEYFQRGWNSAPNDGRFAYQLAWLMATSPVASVRNGRESVRIAKKLCEETGYKNAALLDLLAAAQAESGMFEKAGETARRANQHANSSGKYNLANEISKRLRLYEKNKPYREN